MCQNLFNTKGNRFVTSNCRYLYDESSGWLMIQISKTRVEINVKTINNIECIQ